MTRLRDCWRYELVANAANQRGRRCRSEFESSTVRLCCCAQIFTNIFDCAWKIISYPFPFVWPGSVHNTSVPCAVRLVPIYLSTPHLVALWALGRFLLISLFVLRTVHWLFIAICIYPDDTLAACLDKLAACFVTIVEFGNPVIRPNFRRKAYSNCWDTSVSQTGHSRFTDSPPVAEFLKRRCVYIHIPQANRPKLSDIQHVDRQMKNQTRFQHRSIQGWNQSISCQRFFWYMKCLLHFSPVYRHTMVF